MMAVIQIVHKTSVMVAHVDVPQAHQSTAHVDRSGSAGAVVSQHQLMRLRNRCQEKLTLRKWSRSEEVRKRWMHIL